MFSRAKMLLVGTAVAVLAAGCAGASSQDNTVRPFTDIALSEPKVEVDPSGTSAVLRVATSIDAVCAVSYGEGPELGMIATDQDMGGVGHRDHQAVLGGLAPDREYRYRLQGIGPDGTLYRSELLTFTTPPAPEEGALGANIAVGARVIDVSSEFSASFAAENAVDSDVTTEWSSRGDGDAAFIVLDLGVETTVVGVGFRTRSMSDGTAVTTSFTITVDGGPPLGPFDAGPGLALADVEFTGQVVRIDVEKSTGGNTGASEIEIYSAG